MNEKKKLLIATTDSILPYQPTLLNLYDYLNESFDITIISFKPEYIARNKITDKKVVYLNNKSIVYKTCYLFDLIAHFVLNFFYKSSDLKNYKNLCRSYIQIYLLKKEIKKHHSTQIIAVDFVSLFTVQQLKKEAYFLSLEIPDNDYFRKKINTNLIKAVIIQSKIRFDFLFGINSKLPLFILPNSPVYKEIKNSKNRTGLIWAGSIVPQFGVYSIVDFVKNNKNYQLTLKGGITKKEEENILKKYALELQEKRIILDSTYLPENDFIHFISSFKIGFCFYSWDLLKDDFNYATAPSGKVFMYLAAGIPIIACDILGFDFIKENKCGILINNYSESAIKNAIEEIEKNYTTFSENCIAVAKEYSFDKYAKKISMLLLSEH